MNTEQLTKDILEGRDLSKAAHKKLIGKKLAEFIEQAIQKEKQLISEFSEFVSYIERGIVRITSSVQTKVTQLAPSLHQNIVDYYTTVEVADILNVSERTLKNWQKSGVFPKNVKIKSPETGNWIGTWPKKDVRKWLEDNQERLQETYKKGRRPSTSKDEDEQIENMAGEIEKLLAET